ncbi:hypothetical protein [Halomonas mongoliensis]|uniref:hypothetical protein n=1 Tax=Halomonas mongoliensis TaxID=321265 RepID=UPI00403AC790
MDFKIFIDILASLAAIVAIVSVLVGWYCSSRKPLKIVRVVVHKTQKDMTFILVTKNRQPYPVTTKRIDCYRRKIFEVQKKVGGEPEYSERLSSREALFMGRSEFEVPANANTDLRLKVTGAADIPNRLLFSVDSSHGYHEIWCDEISVLEVGRTEVYSVDYKDEYKSKVAAKVMYRWRIVQELARRCSRRLRRS